VTIFWVKTSIILGKFVATNNGFTKKKFSHLSFVAVFGSGIRDPGSGMGKNQDPGLTSRIRNTATNTGFDYGSKCRIIIIEVLRIRDPVPFHPSLWLLCCFCIRDPGWVKIRIRDKHPGSAEL
jgi:hypothetical protein